MPTSKGTTLQSKISVKLKTRYDSYKNFMHEISPKMIDIEEELKVLKDQESFKNKTV